MKSVDFLCVFVKTFWPYVQAGWLVSKYTQLYWLQRWWCVCCTNKAVLLEDSHLTLGINFKSGLENIFPKLIKRRRPTEWPPLSPYLTRCDIVLRGSANGESADHSPEHPMIWNNKCEILCRCSSALFGKAMSLCLQGCRSVCKILGSTLKFDTKWWRVGFKMVQES